VVACVAYRKEEGTPNDKASCYTNTLSQICSSIFEDITVCLDGDKLVGTPSMDNREGSRKVA